MNSRSRKEEEECISTKYESQEKVEKKHSEKDSEQARLLHSYCLATEIIRPFQVVPHPWVENTEVVGVQSGA